MEVKMIKNWLKIIGLFTLISLNIAPTRASWDDSAFEIITNNKVAVVMTVTTAILTVIIYKLWQENRDLKEILYEIWNQQKAQQAAYLDLDPAQKALQRRKPLSREYLQEAKNLTKKYNELKKSKKKHRKKA
jgi:hypothetical protein